MRTRGKVTWIINAEPLPQSDKLVTLRPIVITLDVWYTTMELLPLLEELTVKELSLIIGPLVILFGFKYYLNALRKKHSAYYLNTPQFSKGTLRKIALAKGDDIGELMFPEEAEEARIWFKEIEQSDPGKLTQYNQAYSLQKEIAIYVQNNGWLRYERLLHTGLQWLSAKVLKEKRLPDAKKGFTGFFSHNSYQLCLTLAFIYPIAFAVISLPVSQQLQIGQLTLVPAITTMEAWLGVLLFVSLAYSFHRLKNSTGWRSVFWLITALFLFGTSAIAAINANIAAAFAVVAFAFVGAAGAGAGAGAVVAAAGAAAAVAVAGAGAGAVAVAAVAAVAAAAAIFAMDRLIENKISSKIHQQMATFLIWLVYAVLGILAILLFGAEDDIALIFLPLILILLPIFNAPIDWLSLNITRWLISKMQQHHHNALLLLVYGFADLIIAVCFVFLLSAMLLLVIVGVNHIGLGLTEQLAIDFNPLMTGLKEAPAEHTWIHLMVVSTLLPTALHFGLVLYSLASWPVYHWGKTAYQRLHDHSSEQNGTFNQDRSRIMLASRFRWGLTLLFIAVIIWLLTQLHSGIFTVADWLWQWADWILWLDPVYQTSH